MHDQIVLESGGAAAEAEILAYKVLVAAVVGGEKDVLPPRDVDEGLVLHGPTCTTTHHHAPRHTRRT